MIKKGFTFRNIIQKKIDNMTENEINKLAKKIAELILHEFVAHNTDEPMMWIEEDEAEMLAELARLMTLMSAYLEREEYEKCAIIKNKINKLEKKLNNL
tara:strand:+ start:509 stop:805 length:297 start_codon:yes stop_codon:yes gene_type:complete